MTDEETQTALENAVDENQQRIQEVSQVDVLREVQDRIFQRMHPMPNAVADAARSSEKIRERRKNWNCPERHRLKREQVIAAGGWPESPWLKTVNTLTAKIGTGYLVALLGTRGPGKTQIGVELMYRTTERGRTALYATAIDLFVSIKSVYRKDADTSEEQVIESFVRPSLLVLDEVHERGETPWEDRLLTNILDRRYRAMKDTILAANLEKDAFDQSMGRSVISRLTETGGVIVCNWPSFRT